MPEVKPRCEVCGKEIRRHARFCVAHHRESMRESARRRRADFGVPHAAWQRRHFGVKGKRIKRQCLKCDRHFMAQGRFNRICDNCAKVNQNLVDYEARYTIVR